MKHFITISFFILSIVLSISTVTASQDNNYSNNALSFDLFKKLDRSKNAVYSPISSEMAFSLVYNGTDGITKERMEETFGFNNQTNSYNKKTLNHLSSLNGIIVNLNNGVWVEQKNKLKNTYVNLMKNDYAAHIGNFSSLAPTQAANNINDWVADSTNNLIKKLLSKNDIKSAQAIFINTVYLDAKWRTPFEKFNNPKKFKGINGEKDVPYMHKVTYYPYARISNKVQIIEVPYKDNDTTMVFILPEEGRRYYLENLMDELTADVFYDWYKKLQPRKVNAKIPKFKIEKRIDLKEKLGLDRSFLSDFSKMFASDPKIDDFKAFQKAFIIVDELGTKAGAATAIIAIATSSIETMPPIRFNVDHPFVYIIFNKSLNRILFMGFCVDIEETTK